MIAAPAVDLKDGRCVQLVGGRPEDERVSLPDPVGVARGWRDRGFRVLHVVDLDAALDRGGNLDLVSRIARDAPGEIQVGGGIRDTERAGVLIGAGVDRIILGTRAIDDPAWRRKIAGHFPDMVIVAVDARSGKVLRRGWTEETSLDVEAFLEDIRTLPLAGVLWTDVGREGRAEGIDRGGAEQVLAASPHPVWISGGITTMDELRFLRDRGAAGAVLGMALYTGILDADEVAEEFGE